MSFGAARLVTAVSEYSAPGIRLLECGNELDRLSGDGELVWPDPASLINGPYLRTTPGVHPCEGFFAAMEEWQDMQVATEGKPMASPGSALT